MFPLYKWGGFGATSPSRVGWFWEAFTEGQNAPTLEGEVAKGPLEARLKKTWNRGSLRSNTLSLLAVLCPTGASVQPHYLPCSDGRTALNWAIGSYHCKGDAAAYLRSIGALE